MNCVLPAFLMARILKSKGHRRRERFYALGLDTSHSYGINITACQKELSAETTRAIKWLNEPGVVCSTCLARSR